MIISELPLNVVHLSAALRMRAYATLHQTASLLGVSVVVGGKNVITYTQGVMAWYEWMNNHTSGTEGEAEQLIGVHKRRRQRGSQRGKETNETLSCFLSYCSWHHTLLLHIIYSFRNALSKSPILLNVIPLRDNAFRLPVISYPVICATISVYRLWH